MNAANTASVEADGGRRYTFQRTLETRGDDSAIVSLSDGKRAFVLGLAAPAYQNSTLTAYDLATGTKLWGPRKYPWRVKAFLADGALYVTAPEFGGGDPNKPKGSVIRYDPVTGATRWRTYGIDELTQPVVVGRILHVGPLSIDTATGQVLQMTRYDDGSLTEMAAEGPWLYHMQAGRARRIEADTMRIDWQKGRDGVSDAQETAIVSGGRLYGWTDGGYTEDTSTVRDTRNGSKIAVRDKLPLAVGSTSIVDLNFSGEEPRLVVRNVATEKVRWQRKYTYDAQCPCWEQPNGAPVLVGNTLLVGLDGGAKRGQKIVAYDVTDGRVTWQQRIPTECRQVGSLTWAAGRLMVPTACGVRLYSRTG